MQHDQPDSRRFHRNGAYLSASEIAELGFCERFVVLSARHGRQDPPDINAARHRGDGAHEAFYAESVAIARRQRAQRPCFLANSVYPDGAAELTTLRRVRDEFLRRSILGRWCVDWYYRASPRLSARWEHAPRWACSAARRGVGLVAAMAALAFAARLQSHPQGER
jgi:hypothetical protein